MKNYRSIVIALWLLVAVTAGEVERVPSDFESGVRLLEPIAEHQALVDRATGLYADAGLELPNLRIDFAAGTDRCPEGVDGRFIAQEPESLILLCPPAGASGLHVRHIILHELAHAWDHHQLDDDRRKAFLELRSAEAWRSRDLAWWEMGSEQAAEIMAWGLIDQPLPIIKIFGNSCEELTAGYELLVGDPPPQGLSCRV